MTPTVAWVVAAAEAARQVIRAASIDEAAVSRSLAVLAEVEALALAACDKSPHAAARQNNS